MSDELYHYGVKGMKWGVRRSEKRQARKTKKAKKRFVKRVKSGWMDSYNRATDNFNAKLGTINEEYKDVNLNGKPTKRGRQYIKKVGTLWTKEYSDALIKDFGPDPINNGRDWVNNMPLMNSYSRMLDMYDRGQL